MARRGSEPNPNLPRITTRGEDEEFLSTCAVTVADLLARLPKKYFAGLRSVDLVEFRREPAASRRRGERRPGQFLLGSYFPAKNSPWIELYVDNLRERFGPKVMGLRSARELALGEVLFHELSHHISRRIEPSHGPAEDQARLWTERLIKMAFEP